MLDTSVLLVRVPPGILIRGVGRRSIARRIAATPLSGSSRSRFLHAVTTSQVQENRRQHHLDVEPALRARDMDVLADRRVAAIIGEVLGRSIRAERIDPKAAAASAGPGAAALEKMFDWYDRRGIQGNALTLRAILGREPRTLLAFFTELAAATGGSIETRAKHDPLLSRHALEDATRLYLGQSEAKDPRASPLYGDVTGLPPSCFTSARTKSCSMMRADTRI